MILKTEPRYRNQSRTQYTPVLRKHAAKIDREETIMVERWENIMFFPTSTIEPGDVMLGKNFIFPNFMMGKNREFFIWQ